MFECGQVAFFQGRINDLSEELRRSSQKCFSYSRPTVSSHFVKYEMPLHKKIYKLEILDGQWDLPILSELQEVLSGQFPEGRFPKDFSQTDNSPTDSSPKDSSPKGQFRKTTFPRWTVHRQFLNLMIYIFLADKKMDFQ